MEWGGGMEAGRTFSFAFISSSVERAPLLFDQFYFAFARFRSRPRAFLQLDFHPTSLEYVWFWGACKYFRFFDFEEDLLKTSRRE